MKVLIVNSEGTLRGGEFQTILLARGLSKRDCEIRLALKKGSIFFKEASEEFSVYPFAFETVPLVTPFRLSSILNRWKPDIVHVQSSKAHTHALLASVISRWSPLLIVSRRTAFPVSSRLSASLKYKRGVDFFLPISKAAALELKRAGVENEKMEIVPSGIELVNFRDIAEHRNYVGNTYSRDGLIIGTVASFEKEKGYGVLLRAAARVVEEFPSIVFSLNGDGRLKAKFVSLARKLGIERNVIFEKIDKPLEKILARFDIFVLSSFQEGLSTALIGALASGCPVVASRTGGIPEVVKGECGILFEPGNSDELAKSIKELIKDEKLRAYLGKRAVECVAEFDIEKTINKTLEIYKRLLLKK